MKNKIDFYLNGKPVSAVVQPETTVLELLRNTFDLKGIKEGCGEGDCGACTVVIGEPVDGQVRYKPVVGCLHPAVQLEGNHLITIEGLGEEKTLHPIQQAVLDAHATQCGFCTPGVILSLLALYLEHENPSPADVGRCLEGNLCRCTGYMYIRKVPDAIKNLHVANKDIRPVYLGETEKLVLAHKHEDILAEAGGQRYFSPVSDESLKTFLAAASGEVRFINGGTDFMVGVKKRHQHHPLTVDLSRVESLKRVSVSKEKIVIGGGVSLAEASRISAKVLPVLSETILKMCSEQVRSIATVAGNIANASPVADTVPVLMALGAQLTIAGAKGERSVPLGEFFLGYKKTDLNAGEWISAITVPLGRYAKVNFEKASKRKELDISAVNSAIALNTENGVIKEAVVACGGVGPTALFMKKTSAYLVGKPFSEETFTQAAEVVAGEATPLSDVRGSAKYRTTMMKNFIIRHYLALSEGERK